jgi:hypothetical protein
MTQRINTNRFADTSVTGLKLSNNSVRGNNIVAGTITGNLIASNAISGNNIATNTITGNLVANNTIASVKLTPVNRLLENANLISSSTSGNVNVSLDDNSVYYVTSNVAGNVTFNIRVSPETTLNSFMANGQSITTAFILTQGSTQFLANLSIDGVYQSGNTRWSSNSRPTYTASLTNSQLDVYTFTSIKIGSNSYSILGSRTAYGFG